MFRFIFGPFNLFSIQKPWLFSLFSFLWNQAAFWSHHSIISKASADLLLVVFSADHSTKHCNFWFPPPSKQAVVLRSVKRSRISSIHFKVQLYNLSIGDLWVIFWYLQFVSHKLCQHFELSFDCNYSAVMPALIAPTIIWPLFQLYVLFSLIISFIYDCLNKEQLLGYFAVEAKTIFCFHFTTLLLVLNAKLTFFEVHSTRILCCLLF